MKQSCFLILHLLTIFHLHAQDSSKTGSRLSIWYSDVSSGRAMSILYCKMLNQDDIVVYGGLNLYINSSSYQNSPSIYTTFFKEFYNKGLNRIGVRLGIEKKILRINDKFSVSGFYDIQFKAGNIDNTSILWIPDTPINAYKEHRNLEINSFENTIGLNFLFKINNRFNFRSQIGLGANFYAWRHKEASDVTLRSLFHNWSVNRMFSFGFDYGLNKAPHIKEKSIKKRQKKPHFYQHGITFSYDDVQTGRNLNIIYQHYIRSNSLLYGGLKFNINSSLYDNYEKMDKSYYFKQFTAMTTGEHIGLKLGYEYLHTVPNTNMQIFAFYDFQLIRSTVRNLVGLDFFDKGLSRETTPLGSIGTFISGDHTPVSNPPTSSYRFYGPTWALENYVGLGFKLSINDKINFRMQGGLGYNFYLGPEKYQSYNIQRWTTITHYENIPWTAKKTEFSRMFSIGLEYKLGRKS